MKIRYFRERAGFTQYELADALGVTQSAISQWENGASRPTIDRLTRLAYLLDCTIEQLLEEEGDSVEL